MSNRFKLFLGGTAALLGVLTLSEAQISSPVPSQKSPATDSLQAASAADSQANPATAPTLPTAPIAKTNENSPLTLVQASTVTAASSPSTTTTTTTNSTLPATTTDPAEADSATDSGGVGVREFQGDDVGQVLRLLARQAKINMVVSEAVVGTVTMRLEDVTALQAIAIIVKAKGLFMTGIDNVYYIKTPAEQTAEPTESDKYQFSYARAEATKALLGAQLQSKDPPMIDERTNTIFYRETRSNIENIRKLLVEIDKPTKQVMIEARLVEVTANPKQAYGINWAGVVGSASNPQTINYAGGNPQGVPTQTVNDDGTITTIPGTPPTFTTAGGKLQGNDFFFDNTLTRLGGQFAILTAPQMSVTIAALNEDSDAEFLANPRVVTADNMQAKIEIIRNQPVPQLTFNEQTASSVFGGFQDKKFGNTLIVKPSINKDHFITLAVKPEISNKVGDQAFFPPGATQPVLSPIIDTRSLDSNVLIKSGDTLAIGGLLQDEVTKSRTKVPLVGDIPIVGYLFQSRTNIRTKRNLLVFVTPTIIDQRYGTGLEDQISGVHNTGEEYADPNGWRNNAKGAVRLVPTANRQVVADYPKPGTPPAPARGRTTTTTTTEKVQFMSTAKDRDF